MPAKKKSVRMKNSEMTYLLSKLGNSELDNRLKNKFKIAIKTKSEDTNKG